LDDPFIFELMEVFGADGYLTFFGILEIYSREFKPEDGWKLSVTRSFLRQKLHKRQDTIIIKCLEYIGSHGNELLTSSARVTDEFGTSSDLKTKLPTNSRQTPDKLVTNLNKEHQNSGKWNIEFKDMQVVIFIPKFTEILDDWTIRKLRSGSVVTPKILTTELDKEEDKDIKKKIVKKIVTASVTYDADFLQWYEKYPNKIDRKGAFKAWQNVTF
jgi:hypothetical protein